MSFIDALTISTISALIGAFGSLVMYKLTNPECPLCTSRRGFINLGRGKMLCKGCRGVWFKRDEGFSKSIPKV
jgi:hypothetical protein